jgi:NAD(P)-dependent dehydrogenase (short-subunit alcohol dehydrogenase family)
MKRLQGKVAWISGATSGIGEATARLFVEEGAAVAITGIDAKAGRHLARELNAQGGSACYFPCDVRSETAVRTSIRNAVRRFGRLDIVVNNAGITHIRPLLKYSSREWDLVIGVNVKAMFFAAKHAIPYLRRNRRGYIVNVGSISSFVAQALTPVYTVAKHAVVGLTKSIALDFAVDGIRCNTVCPGVTDTPMLRIHLNRTPDPEAALAKRVRRVPIGVALTPRDIAKSILFLSCEDSSGVTGASHLIDGGYLTPAEWDTGGYTAFMPGSPAKR